MPLLNYKKEFVPAVESGVKRCTFRAWREDGKDPKIGDTLYHYTGLRTQYSRKLREDICTNTTPATICAKGIQLGSKNIRNIEELHVIAANDGFNDWPHMMKWFEKQHGPYFNGLLIEW